MRTIRGTKCFKLFILTAVFLSSVHLFYMIYISEDNDTTIWKSEEDITKAIRTTYLTAPSRSPYHLSTNPKYIATRHKYGWPVIDHYLRILFANHLNGFFVEAGAYDGEYLSNTLRLEMEQNWTGLLIEPNPKSYLELLRKNRKSWSTNTCLSTEPFPKKATIICRRLNQTITSVDNPWIYEGSTHEIGYTLPPIYKNIFAKTSTSAIKVQCFPLISYLIALNVTTVDLVSLDVQGSEQKILKWLPFDRVKVKVFVVESTASKVFDKNLEKFFELRNYRLIACDAEINYIFILKTEFENYHFPRISRGEYLLDLKFLSDDDIFANTKKIKSQSQNSGQPFDDILHYIKPPSSKPYNLSNDPFYNEMKNNYSWPFINVYLKILFENKYNGFFLEAGALDGEFLSNTLFLEREFRWRGILIEPNPYSYAELLHKNRKAWSSNTCISTKKHRKNATIVLKGLKAKRKKGVHPYVYIGTTHELGYSSKNNTSSRTHHHLDEERVVVPCFPLISYLDALKVPSIDLISLDMQGSEREVVKTIPFSRLKVRVLVIESTNGFKFDFDLVKFMNEKNYRLIACDSEPNYIFILNGTYPRLNFPKNVECNQWPIVHKKIKTYRPP